MSKGTFCCVAVQIIVFSLVNSALKRNLIKSDILRSQYSKLHQHDRNSPGNDLEQVLILRSQIEKLGNENLFVCFFVCFFVRFFVCCLTTHQS